MVETTIWQPKRATRLDGLSPVEVAGRLRHLPGLVFFDTVGHVPAGAGQPISIIAARPQRVLEGSVYLDKDRRRLRDALEQGASVCGDLGFPMGGLCGWVDYEGGFVFGDYPEMLGYRHSDQSWMELGGLSECLREVPDEMPEVGEFLARTSREEFMKSVERAKDWIAAGDIYQVNLSQAFEAEVSGGSLFGLYEALRDHSPAPMAAWMSLGGREVLSSSPETFLRISGRGIETRPIKGTRPRFADADEDTRSAHELQTSAKEIAELVMITDLLRNDIGQVCEFGTVEVTDLLRLESLAQVHHLVSTVKGIMRMETDAIDAVAACFPGGSITGAPKKRAMEIISELEGSPRGLYCGAIGCFGFNGESVFNIAIRTLVREGDRLTYHVGAGIVADSVPEQEYEETMQKGVGIRIGVEKFKTSGQQD